MCLLFVLVCGQDLWGFVPGSGPGPEMWQQFTPPPANLATALATMGPSWLGMDVGEQGWFVRGQVFCRVVALSLRRLPLSVPCVHSQPTCPCAHTHIQAACAHAPPSSISCSCSLVFLYGMWGPDGRYVGSYADQMPAAGVSRQEQFLNFRRHFGGAWIECVHVCVHVSARSRLYAWGKGGGGSAVWHPGFVCSTLRTLAASTEPPEGHAPGLLVP